RHFATSPLGAVGVVEGRCYRMRGAALSPSHGAPRSSGGTAVADQRALREPLLEALHDTVLGADRREPDRIRDGDPRARAVRDDDEAAKAEQIGAAVGLGIESLAQATRSRADEDAADLPAQRGPDLRAEGVEDALDRSLEGLQRDVAGEAVRHDDV